MNNFQTPEDAGGLTDYLKPKPKGDMSVKDIVAADLAKNHSHEQLDVDAAYKILAAQIQSGAKLYRSNNTIFITKKIGHDAIEFHTINGESGRQLMENVILYLTQLKAEGINSAVTYYDNPKITSLWQQSKLNVDITKVNQGQDRTFEAKVRL